MPSIPSERAIWRIDSGSVKSSIRDVAKEVDKEGDHNGKVSMKEVDAFIQRRDWDGPNSSGYEPRRAAEVLKSHLLNEPEMPLALDVAFVLARRPMTKVSDWLGKIM